ncbi:MAG: anti-sigma factor antagonist [Oscillospiraceae bacterium]
MFRLQNEDDTMFAFLSGELDHHMAKQIREEIDSEVVRLGINLLYLDFKDVTFMDSSGIGLVMGRYKLLNSLNGEVKIVNCSSQIKKVMRLAGLDKIAEIR